jgi:hypothetical protein
MKNKIITALVAAVMTAGSAFAQQPIEITGEVKTGFFMEQREIQGVTREHARLYNNDGDSGREEGSIRLGINFELENFGLRTQFFRQEYKPEDQFIRVGFAYAYGYLFDRQLKISAGILGESPWGSGGPELKKELETIGGDVLIPGIRTEWMPGFLPGLNLGFVLNRDDNSVPPDTKQKFGDIFGESILGIAYENDYFAFRFAYRFNREIDSPAVTTNGARFVYRVEERMLTRLLPGMAIWANGYSNGINPVSNQGATDPWIQNWLYILYDPEYFSVGLNIGYRDTVVTDTQRLEFRPFFYYKLFNNFLNVGVMGGMEIGYNAGKNLPDAFYNFWFVEPQVKVNINSNYYIAAVYRYHSGIYAPDPSYVKDQVTHWFNLRFCYTL